MRYGDLKFSRINETEEKAIWQLKNGYLITVVREGILHSVSVFPHIDAVQPFRKGTKQDVIDYITELAQIPAKSGLYEDSELDSAGDF